MGVHSRRVFYIISSIVFGFSLVGMIIYGYKTFYIEQEPSQAEEYTYHFALIAEEMDNAYWRLVEKGAKKAAADHDIYLEYIAPQKANNDQNLTLLDRMISAQVDGIIIQGIDEDRFVDLVHKGNERNIPVVTIDADVKSSERKAYVGTDNIQAGELLGKALLKSTTGEQYVGIVTGRKDAKNQQERIKGFKQAVDVSSRIHIVTIKESQITEVGASTATYTLLKQHPQITALVGTSSLDGIGIVEGLQEIAPNKDVYVGAFDTLPRTLDLIEQQKIDTTIAQYPEKMGRKSVHVLMDLQQKDVLLNNVLFTESKIIDQQDAPVETYGELK